MSNEAMAHDITHQTEEENEMLADMNERCNNCVWRDITMRDGGWCYLFKRIQVVCMRFKGIQP